MKSKHLAVFFGVVSIILAANTCYLQSKYEEAYHTLREHLYYDKTYNHSECEEQIYELWDNEVPNWIRTMEY